MKTQFVTLLTILSLMGMIGCTGPQGDPGPQGAAGATGAAGSKGDPGTAGNANAVYSDWKTPAWDGPIWGIGSAAGTSIGLSMASSANPLLTKDAINTAAIYTYIKYNELVAVATNPQTYTLVERITFNASATSYFKIPGRTTSRREDFSSTGFGYDAYAENYFAPRATILTSVYDATKGVFVPIPDLINKTESFYKDLVKTLPQYRQVIVFGNVKGGRLATINWRDYDEVKTVLNLKD